MTALDNPALFLSVSVSCTTKFPVFTVCSVASLFLFYDQINDVCLFCIVAYIILRLWLSRAKVVSCSDPHGIPHGIHNTRVTKHISTVLKQTMEHVPNDYRTLERTNKHGTCPQ